MAEENSAHRRNWESQSQKTTRRRDWLSYTLAAFAVGGFMYLALQGQAGAATGLLIYALSGLVDKILQHLRDR